MLSPPNLKQSKMAFTTLTQYKTGSVSQCSKARKGNKRHTGWKGKKNKTFPIHRQQGFPGGSDGKESACNAGDLASIPESRRSSGEGNGNPLQYSCLENPMDRWSWLATVDEFAKNWRTNWGTNIFPLLWASPWDHALSHHLIHLVLNAST